MTTFFFSAGSATKNLEIGACPSFRTSDVSVTTVNDPRKYPFGHPFDTKATPYTTDPSIVITDAFQVIKAQHGSGRAIQTLSGVCVDFADQRTILSAFFDLNALAASKGEVETAETLKQASYDLLAAQLDDQRLSTQFDGSAIAYYAPPTSSDQTVAGYITVAWDIQLKKILTKQDIDSLEQFVKTAINNKQKLTYSKA